MPRKNGRLTPQEVTIAKVYASTGDVAYAAHKANVSQRGAELAIARPAVREESNRLLAEQMQDAIVPLALKRHKQILEDPNSSGPTLTKSIEMAYKYGQSSSEELARKEFHEMTKAELDRETLRLTAYQRELAMWDKTIEGTAVEAPAEPQLVDPPAVFG